MSRNRALTSLLAAAALLPAAAAAASTPSTGLDVHPIFGASASGGIHVGQPLFVAPRGKHKVRSVCWTPAPVDGPACSTSKFGAPAKTGAQKIDVTLTDGTVLSTAVTVTRAATKLPGNGPTAARPMQVSCSTQLYGNGYDGHLRDARTPAIAAGDHVAAYYRVPKHAHIVQVWDYRHRAAGFVKDSCLKPLASPNSIG